MARQIKTLDEAAAESKIKTLDEAAAENRIKTLDEAAATAKNKIKTLGEANQSAGKSCNFCKDGNLVILPLRYTVVCSANPADLAGLPALPGTLGKGVSDIALTANACYAVRQLREGFLYVLIERDGDRTWQAYAVTPGSELYSFEPTNPPAEPPVFSCQYTGHSANASMVKITRGDHVQNVWMLFTPNPLTETTLHSLKSNPAEWMQAFSPAGWLGGDYGQNHTLKAGQLYDLLVEQIAERAKSAPFNETIVASLYPPFTQKAYSDPQFTMVAQSVHLNSLASRLAMQASAVSADNKVQDIGALAFVLHDPIGITQELNAFRNRPLETLQKWLETEKEVLENSELVGTVTNDHRLKVMHAIDNVSWLLKGIGKKMGEGKNNEIALKKEEMLKEYEALQVQTANYYMNRGTVGPDGILYTDPKEHEEYKRTIQVTEEIYLKKIQNLEDSVYRKYLDNYFGYFDYKEKEAFQQEFTTVTQKANEDAKRHYADHLAWLQSRQLLNAFAVYDTDHDALGLAFQGEVGQAIAGMANTPQGEAVLNKWKKDFAIQDNNLFLRAFCYNQKSIQNAFKIAATSIKEVPDFDDTDGMDAYLQALYAAADADQPGKEKETEKETDRKGGVTSQTTAIALSVVSPLKDLVKVFDKTVKSLGETVADQKKWLANNKLAWAVQVPALYAQRVMGSSIKPGEERIARTLGVLFPATLGNASAVATYGELERTFMKKHRGQLLQTINAQKEKGVFDKIARVEVEKQIERWKNIDPKNALKGDFLRIRFAMVILSLEAINLFFKARKKGEDESRLKYELGAAALGCTAAALELIAYQYRTISRSGVTVGATQAAGVRYGGWKLTAATTALGASFIGAGLDFESVGVAWKADRIDLAILLGLRGLDQVALGLLSASTAYADAEQLFTFYAGKAAQGSTSRAILSTLARGATAVNKVKYLLYNYAAVLGWGYLALTGIILTVNFFWKDELEEWCNSSCFRVSGGIRKRLTSTPPLFTNAEAEIDALHAAFQLTFPMKEEQVDAKQNTAGGSLQEMGMTQ